MSTVCTNLAAVHSVQCPHHLSLVPNADKSGQSKLLDALDVARDRLGSQDVTDLIALLNKGGLIG